MAKSSFYLTTPIYYVNDIPHIGHAYTTIAADVLSRYYKKMGSDVFFLTGTDEHGAKIDEAAKKALKTPKEFVDELVPKFQKAWQAAGIEYSEFLRTTNPKHEKLAQEFVMRLINNGFVEKRMYEGLYCISCEKYYTAEELVEGKCPDHKREPVLQKEENYFFLLSRFQNELEKVIKKGEMRIRPKARENEVLGKIRAGLEDVSISRENVKWGIKFPNDETQTIYVWIEALLNYYSATKIYKDAPDWPADLHLMAKDILWFHAIIWPAMLLAAGESLPKEVFAHGFFTIDGQKMSKTLGNTLDPVILAKKYGTDTLRYCLLREFPFGEDGDISEGKIVSRYNSDLANELGNLLQRVLTMINKYDLKVEILVPAEIYIDKQMGDLRFDLALEQIWENIRHLNVIIENEKPWELVKNNPVRLLEVMNGILEELAGIAEALEPFMPETAKKIKEQLDTLEPEPLFPRLEKL